MFGKDKKKSVSKKTRKKVSDKRKIYKTTDGYFTRNDKNTKPRRIAVVKQRKDDGGSEDLFQERQEWESICGKAGIKAGESFFNY